MLTQRYSLADTTDGKEYRIVAVEGRGCLENVLRMGLSEGARVKCISNIRRGPVILRYGHTDLAIGRGMAERIMVEPLPSVQTKSPTGGNPRGILSQHIRLGRR